MRRRFVIMLAFCLLLNFAALSQVIKNYGSESLAFKAPVPVTLRWGFVTTFVFPERIASVACGLSEFYAIEKRGNMLFIKVKDPKAPPTNLFVEAGKTLWSFILKPTQEGDYDHLITVEGATLEGLKRKMQEEMQKRLLEKEQLLKEGFLLLFAGKVKVIKKSYKDFTVELCSEYACLLKAKGKSPLAIAGAAKIYSIHPFYIAALQQGKLVVNGKTIAKR